MSLLKCPKCGEMFSDSYKTCPFCAEDEEFYKGGKKPKKSGRRMEGHQKTPSILGPVMVVVVLLLVGLLGYMFFGGAVGTWLDGLKDPKPPVSDPVDPGVTDPGTDTLVLNKTELTLSVGGTEKLTVTGAEEVTWSSSDDTVVTVSADGTVTGVKSGSATVSAMSGTSSVACTVKVAVRLEDLKLMTQYGAVYSNGTNYDTTMTKIGETYEMSVDGTDSPVEWSVENSSIATVDANGNLKSVSSGKTILTAKVDGHTLTCIVRVN